MFREIIRQLLVNTYNKIKSSENIKKNTKSGLLGFVINKQARYWFSGEAFLALNL